MSSSRSRSIGPIPTGCPRADARGGRYRQRAARRARGDRRGLGGQPKPNPRLDNRLKDVEEKLELPPLKPELRSFVDWVANYTRRSRGMVLRMCLRMGEHLGAERERVGVRLAGPPPQRMTAARARVLALLADGMVRGKSDAAREAGVSAGVIDGLIDEGTLETVVLPPEPVAEKPDPDFAQHGFHRGPERRRSSS